jgi:Fic family protein
MWESAHTESLPTSVRTTERSAGERVTFVWIAFHDFNEGNEHGFITHATYRELTGVSDRTAHRDLEALIERGRLKGAGQKRARRYVLP